MIFGKRSVRHEFGVFSSEQCPSCQSSGTYKFVCIKTYLVVFFLNLIPLFTRYETVCEECGDTQELDQKAGRAAADAFFGRSRANLSAVIALKLCAAAAVIAAAVALPLTLSAQSGADPETLKSLVSEDGVYSIQNFDGDVLGIVEVSDGEKLLTFYDDMSILVGEPGANGQFVKHEHYQEAADGSGETILVRIPDSAGVLKDKNGTVVRQYHYSQVSGALGYTVGVEDLSAITYTSEKVVYPFSYYQGGQSDPAPYTVVVYLPQSKKVEATFAVGTSGKEELATIVVSAYENGRAATETIYRLDAAAIAAAQEAGLSPGSAAQDILGFIENKALVPSMSVGCTYHKNTHVLSKIDLNMPDSAGTLQSYVQTFDVTEKGGYYILQAADADSAA